MTDHICPADPCPRCRAQGETLTGMEIVQREDAVRRFCAQDINDACGEVHEQPATCVTTYPAALDSIRHLAEAAKRWRAERDEARSQLAELRKRSEVTRA